MQGSNQRPYAHLTFDSYLYRCTGCRECIRIPWKTNHPHCYDDAIDKCNALRSRCNGRTETGSEIWQVDGSNRRNCANLDWTKDPLRTSLPGLLDKSFDDSG